MNTAPTTPTRDDGGEGTSRSDPQPRRRIGWIVVASLFIGLAAALLLVAAPFIPAEESKVTGGLLCGFALGWATLAVLSRRFSDQPQSWAWAPALFMGISGLLLLAFGSSVQGFLSWIWPPTLLVLVVWMIIRSRQQLKSGSRWLLYPVFGVLLLASVGGAYETVSGAFDAGPYPMPGELIDIGDHRLHLNCTGSGSPTVVLQSGGGEMSSAFGWIAPAIASETQVCVYDRAGRGWSEPAVGPQDAAQISFDLRTLLDRGNIPGPYLLAGHSFGGLYVLTYAALYPDDVAGLVLIDSTAPASEAPVEMTSEAPNGAYDLSGRITVLLSSSARLGLSRLIAQADYGSLPPQSRDEIRASASTASYAKSTLDEYIQAAESGRQAATLTDFKEKPLVVLTAGLGSSATWMTAQDRLATLSTNSSHRVIDGAVHAGLVHDEQYAASTTRAILDVLSSLRTGDALVP